MTSRGSVQPQPFCDMKLIAVEIEFRSYVPDLSAKGNLVLFFFHTSWLSAEGSRQYLYSSYQHTSSFFLQEVLGIKALERG